jgi:hypothetical protein
MSSSARGLNPWGSNNGFVADYKLCGTNSFQAHDLLQHCEVKGNNYHKATAFYLRTLFGASRKRSVMPIKSGIKHATVHHEKMSMINQERQLMQTHKFLFVIITLSTVKKQTMSIK